MVKKLNAEAKAFLQKLEMHHNNKEMPEKFYQIFLAFFESFHESLNNGSTDTVKQFHIFLDLCLKNFTSPYQFPLHHKKIRTPFDYFRFSVNFFRPLVNFEKSKLLGDQNFTKIKEYIEKGENVILLSNHQTEPDPQFISLLTEEKYPFITDKIISVAGEKVTTDPFAIPFSLGTDLLCIYSKKYIDNPPEHQHEKQVHNNKTMEVVKNLLKNGSTTLWVAPSGGRDRADKNGKILPSPFDPKSIEMFYLIAQRAKTPTHFFPLALSTYNLFPPPEATVKEVGEPRSTKKGPILISLGNEIDMKKFDQIADKNEKRAKRTEFVFEQVCSEYQKISSK